MHAYTCKRAREDSRWFTVLQAALRNIHYLCPPLATILTKTYRKHPELLIDGETLFSREGTTQGDPLAMAMYAIGILPLVDQIKSFLPFPRSLVALVSQNQQKWLS